MIGEKAMCDELLTHTELAKVLGLSEGTLKNTWREYPYIAVTPSALRKPNLRGVRFSYTEVLDFLRQQTKQGVEYGNSGIQRTRGQVPSVLQIRREDVQQSCDDQRRRESLGGSKKKGITGTERPEARFDVFQSIL